eukprot:TRINITY_DN78386_c0_g1_i1.p2 TRINITY_DN78386_c0_g1~~TRINITY_DN78386_c0_g1_i1.p2  ORF type:complete len:135 (-),score=18.01 TRINITY_DN78386_c0_g1_i1:217-621(-)
MLGDIRHPISDFGASEGEWTCPANMRGIVHEVIDEPTGRTASGGATVQQVRISGINRPRASKAVLQGELEDLICGALLIAIGTSNLEKRSMLMDIVCSLCKDLGHVLKVKNANAIQAWVHKISSELDWARKAKF